MWLILTKDNKGKFHNKEKFINDIKAIEYDKTNNQYYIYGRHNEHVGKLKSHMHGWNIHGDARIELKDEDKRTFEKIIKIKSVSMNVK